MSLTNNIDHNTVHRSLFSYRGHAGVGTNVTRVDSSSGNHCTSCATKGTATTGGCPLVGWLFSSSPCCCAGKLLRTRGCPVVSGVLRSEARRISTVNSNVDSERSWREEDILLFCSFLRTLITPLPVLHILH